MKGIFLMRKATAICFILVITSIGLVIFVAPMIQEARDCFPNESQMEALYFDQAGFSAANHPRISVNNSQYLRPLIAFEEDYEPRTELKFSPDGQFLIATGRRIDPSSLYSACGSIWVWSIGSDSMPLVLRSENQAALGVEIDSNSYRFLSDELTRGLEHGYMIRTFAVLDAPPVTIQGGGSRIAEFSIDGSLVALATHPRGAKLWSIDDDSFRNITGSEGFTITQIEFSPDNLTIAYADQNNDVHLWDMQTGNEIQVLHGHEEPVQLLTFSLDGMTLASASYEFPHSGSVRLWDIQNGQQRAIFNDLEVKQLEFNSDSTLLISADYYNQIYKWNVQTGEEVTRTQLPSLNNPSRDTFQVEFSSNFEMVATRNNDGRTLDLWHVWSGERLFSLVTDNDLLGQGSVQAFIQDVAFSSDEQLIAIATAFTDLESGNGYGAVQIWGIPINDRTSN